MLDFSTTVQKRQSIRAFKDMPLSRAEIEAVLQDTFRAPSAVNAQPWQIHIASGPNVAKIIRRIGRCIGKWQARSRFFV